MIDPHSLSRLPLRARDELDDDGRALYDSVANDGRLLAGLAGPSGIWLYSPRLGAHMRAANQYLRSGTVLGRRLTELAILVTAREVDSQFEWTMHEPVALREGLDEAVVDLVKGRKPVVAGVAESEAVIIAFGREVFRERKVSDETFTRAVALFGRQGVVELAALMGNYAATAVMLAAVDQQLRPDQPPLLPTVASSASRSGSAPVREIAPTAVQSDARAANAYWGRAGLEQAILDALAARGRDLDALTIDDLAPADHFHSGGKQATQRLGRLAGLTPGMRVLDVGGGLGGPARTLAVEFGCHVTLVDLTEAYVRAGEAFTARLGLAERVTHRVGDALEIDRVMTGTPPFDVVWTQNSGMNIADKERLYAAIAPVVRPGGLLAIQEPMAGPVQPPIYPLMWARDGSQSFLREPREMRALIEAAGFRARAWQDVTADVAGTADASQVPPHAIQRIVMGAALDDIVSAGARNRHEQRIVMIQAVLERGA